MALEKKSSYTSEDYWNLPDGQRAELIDGELFFMSPPGRVHQRLVAEFILAISGYIKINRGGCEVYPAPFAVNPDAEKVLVYDMENSQGPEQFRSEENIKALIFADLVINIKKMLD